MFKRVSEFLKSEAVARTFNYYFMFICLGLATGIGGPTLPALAEQTGIRVGQMGYMFMLSSIGYTLGTLLGGRFFDRVRGHPVLGMSQLFSALLIFFIPLAPWFWLLLVIVFSKGLSDGMLNTGANTLLVWTHKEKAGPFMNALHFFFGLGAFLSPFLVAQLTGIPSGYRWAYWSVAIIGAIVGIRLLFLPGSPKSEHTHTDENGAPSKVFYPLIIMAALYLFFYVGAAGLHPDRHTLHSTPDHPGGADRLSRHPGAGGTAARFQHPALDRHPHLGLLHGPHLADGLHAGRSIP